MSIGRKYVSPPFERMVVMYTEKLLIAIFLTLTIIGCKNRKTDLEDRALVVETLQEHPTVESLVQLLQLNGDHTSEIKELGHPTNSAGVKNVEKIKSAGRDYVAVVARRYPSEIRPAFNNGLGICFIFDSQGNLLTRFGGELGLDKLNGDDVQLKTLGIKDRWFVQVMCFEKHEPFTHRSDVFLIEEDFPLAFRIWGFPNAMAWTSEPKPTNGQYRFAHFFNPGGLPWGTKGIGRDGKEYDLIIGWDDKEGMFRGPSSIRYNGKDVYQIALSISKKFQAIDLNNQD
jgi:hypothetical protein